VHVGETLRFIISIQNTSSRYSCTDVFIKVSRISLGDYRGREWEQEDIGSKLSSNDRQRLFYIIFIRV